MHRAKWKKEKVSGKLRLYGDGYNSVAGRNAEYASGSVWLEREWRTMLNLKGLDVIEPISLDDPEKVSCTQQSEKIEF